MIQRPCKKCLVQTVCNQACGQIRERARIFDHIEVILSITSIVAIMIVSTMPLFVDDKTNNLASVIASGMVLYFILSFVVMICYLKPQRSKVYHRFNEHFPSGQPMIRLRPNSSPNGQGPQSPPQPPPRRYLTH